MTAFLWGVKNGELQEVKEFVAKEKDVVNKEISGRYPLHYASDYGQTEIIKFLIDHGADINKPDKHGITPLLSAIWEGHTESVKLLLQKGARKDGKSPTGQSYLECAEKPEIMALLK